MAVAPVPSSTQKAVNRERSRLLVRVQHALDGPMIFLGLAWLVLLVVEFIRGLTPVLEMASYVIWALFVLDFLLRFTLAPEKLPFLKSNWLTAISLVVPALRVFRITRFLRVFRTVRAVRGIRLVRVLSSLNRGMKSLAATMNRRGFGYLLALSVAVLLAGAAGMFAFEKDLPDGFDSYGEALWWTSMLLISLGSEYWPQSGEGRALCFLLALYGFAVLGYFTALLASFFLDRDAASNHAEIAGAKQIAELQKEVRQLRVVLEAYLPPASGGKKEERADDGGKGL
ncbi:potassium channel protein [Nibribacter ruber]|uniref:Potassium channel protein n=1 Tax=Nibribacter ruber TaxID=2698458 RepID=A0A6P1P2G6_9BACT|nr:ion transporter [Nibribacter ruber]QHL88597.1 potassium channel protein [Nibribacter ruber]